MFSRLFPLELHFTYKIFVLKIEYRTFYIHKEVRDMTNNNSSNKLAVPGVQQALDQMKYEIAQEFGVQLGADASARANGSVGGEITKRLVQMAESQLKGMPNNNQ